MHNRSMNHARNRVTGPASSCENTIPSGVRMESVLAFMIEFRVPSSGFRRSAERSGFSNSEPGTRNSELSCPRFGEEQREQNQFNQAES